MAEPQRSNLHYMNNNPPPEDAIEQGIPPNLDDEGGERAGAARGGKGSKPKGRQRAVNVGQLATLFKYFAYQYGSDIAWDKRNRMAMKISHMRHTFGHDVVKMWITSEKRADVMPDDVVFDPTGTCAPHCVNLFGGLTMEPAAGECEPIMELLRHLCGGDEGLQDWVLNWLALPLQRLGTKMRTAIVVHGDEGSGKNFFFELVRDIYGEYGLVVGQDQLEDKFNDWLSKRLFIIGDEVVTRQELRHHKGRLKAMISGREIQINTKMMPLRRESNHVNLVFLSNELQPLELDASDRRYCVIWTPPKREKSFYDSVSDCVDAGGLAAFYHLLMTRNLEGFDEYTQPPMGQAKSDLIDISRKSPDRFWLDWSTGEIALPLRACSSEQAYRAYQRWCRLEGERYPLTKAVFARMVQRLASDRLRIRPAKTPGASGRTVRMWLPAPPPQEVDFGQWSKDSIDAFEADLREWIGEEANHG